MPSHFSRFSSPSGNPVLLVLVSTLALCLNGYNEHDIDNMKITLDLPSGYVSTSPIKYSDTLKKK